LNLSYLVDGDSGGHEWPSNYGSKKRDYLKNVPNLLEKRFQRDQDCLSMKDWQSFYIKKYPFSDLLAKRDPLT
jgi:hypothetical protein